MKRITVESKSTRISRPVKPLTAHHTSHPMRGDDEAPLIFVYRGGDFPGYGIKSLSLSSKTTSNRLIVLSDVERPWRVAKTVRWEHIDGFYDPAAFAAFASNSTLDANFRGGFWLHTAERFFILEQFVARQQIPRFFHGELDCLFFELGSVERAIMESSLSGMFLPRETRNRVVASLVYVNDQTSLTRACHTLLEKVSLGNEMDILGSLPLGQGSPFHAFPTAEYLFRDSPSIGGWDVAPPNPSFIIDGAVLGRWLFGVDPRNTRTGASKNLVQNPKNTLPFDFPVSDLHFKMDPSNKRRILVQRDTNRWLPIAVVHVHSKIHKKLSSQFVRSIVRNAEAGRQRVILRSSLRYRASTTQRFMRQIWRTLKSPAAAMAFARKMSHKSWWSGARRRWSA